MAYTYTFAQTTFDHAQTQKALLLSSGGDPSSIVITGFTVVDDDAGAADRTSESSYSLNSASGYITITVPSNKGKNVTITYKYGEPSTGTHNGHNVTQDDAMTTKWKSHQNAGKGSRGTYIFLRDTMGYSTAQLGGAGNKYFGAE